MLRPPSLYSVMRNAYTLPTWADGSVRTMSICENGQKARWRAMRTS